jgi:class 3 adenylate cyclase
MSAGRTVIHGAPDARLRELFEERLRPAADRAAIDARIWELYGQDWCVMATDLSGFSRGVAEHGIVHFLQTIYESERILAPLVGQHRGILLKVEGDSFLAIFGEPADALRASIEMQRSVRAYNQSKSPTEQVLLGVGLGYGRVLRVAETEVFGVEVNAACILGETYAKGYDILVTEAVRARAGDGLQFEPFTPAPPGAGAAWKVAD